MSSVSSNTDSVPPLYEKSIDTAIKECGDNISRHGRYAFLVVTVALILIAIISFTTYFLAKLESESRDNERVGLMLRIDDARAYLENTNKEMRIKEIDLSRKSENNLALQKLYPNDKKYKQELIDSYKAEIKEAESFIKESQDKLKTYISKPLITAANLYGTILLIVIVISVSTSMYRFHLRELTKNEQYKLGFMRARIAANNAMNSGFQSEVRSALTSGAFEIQPVPTLFGRREKVESPLPGHPTSEIATVILNKFLEEIDIVLRPKAKT